MQKPLFRSKFYPTSNSDKLACVIAGYRGKIETFDNVINVLNSQGYCVIAYEHSPTVLTSGDPQLLIDLVEGIRSDFAKRAAKYKYTICTGASIGAGLCLGLQMHYPLIKFGIYAGAGVSPPESVFEAPLFYFARRKFVKRGFDPHSLRKVWEEVDILPTKPMGASVPFIMALGRKDRIVKFEKATATLESWQASGEDIKIIIKNRLGHAGIIRWYKKHFRELLLEAERQYS